MSSQPSDQGSNLGRMTMICSWIFTLLAIIGMCCQVIHWKRKRVEVGLDGLILASSFLSTNVLVVQTTWAIVDEGQGKHIDDESRTEFAKVAHSLLASETLWGIVNALFKTAASLFIRRIFGNNTRVINLANTVAIISILHGLAILLEAFLICRPISAGWDPKVTGSCGNQIASYLVLEIIGLLIDFALLMIPLFAIGRLQMTLRRKVQVSGVFSIGFIVTVITGLRIQALNKVTSSDFTYSKGYLALLSALGALLSVITSCANAMFNVIRDCVYNSRNTGINKRNGFIAVASRDNTNHRVRSATSPFPKRRESIHNTASLAQKQNDVNVHGNADLESTAGSIFDRGRVTWDILRQPGRSHHFEEPGRWHGVTDQQTGAENKNSLYYPGDIVSVQPVFSRPLVYTEGLSLPCPATLRTDKSRSFSQAKDVSE